MVITASGLEVAIWMIQTKVTNKVINSLFVTTNIILKKLDNDNIDFFPKISPFTTKKLFAIKRFQFSLKQLQECFNIWNLRTLEQNWLLSIAVLRD